MDTWPHHQMDPLGPMPLLIPTHGLCSLEWRGSPVPEACRAHQSWTKHYPPVTRVCPIQAAGPASPGDREPRTPLPPREGLPDPQGAEAATQCMSMSACSPVSCPVAPHASDFFWDPSGLRNPTPTKLQSWNLEPRCHLPFQA